MADPEKSQESGGTIPVLIAACLTAVVGLGTGFSISAFMMPAAEHGSDASTTAKKRPAEQAGKHGSQAEQAEDEKNHGAAHGQEDSENAETAEEQIDPAKLAFAAIPPVIVNLREQSSLWVRIEGGIQYVTDGEIPPDAVGAVAAEIAMNYFRTLAISDFAGGDALQLIKMDLAEIALSLSNGQIRGFTFTSFIIE